MRILMTAFNSSFFGYGRSLIDSFLKFHPNYHVYCWVVNCSKEQIEELNHIPNVHLCVEYNEKFKKTKRLRGYIVTKRFYAWHKMMTAFGNVNECITIDADALIMGNVDYLYDMLNDYDILFKFNNPRRGKKNFLAGGCLIFKNVPSVCKYFQRYCVVHNKTAKSRGYKWYDDQRILYSVFQEMQNELKWGNIPSCAQSQGRTCKGSIWQFTGERKRYHPSVPYKT